MENEKTQTSYSCVAPTELWGIWGGFFCTILPFLRNWHAKMSERTTKYLTIEIYDKSCSRWKTKKPKQAIPVSLLRSFGAFGEDNFVPYCRSYGTGMLK
ncbi:MAG: hypothetical protein KJ578_07140 [Bacteroidetes bacterium]|nr:hypothetical protein [Bacteroidota bacterium]